MHDGDTLGPNSFQRAIWYPYRDEEHDATTCYYQGPEGERVTLFQRTGYGEVPRPVGTSWTDTSMDEFPFALECVVSPSACGFNFG